MFTFKLNYYIIYIYIYSKKEFNNMCNEKLELIKILDKINTNDLIFDNNQIILIEKYNIDYDKHLLTLFGKMEA